MILYKVILSALVSFLAGYAIGRRQGKVEGKKGAERLYPIEMKRILLESGLCPVCKNNIDMN